MVEGAFHMTDAVIGAFLRQGITSEAPKGLAPSRSNSKQGGTSLSGYCARTPLILTLREGKGGLYSCPVMHGHSRLTGGGRGA